MASDPINDLLARTEILRAPAHRLATFGSTRIAYHLISMIDEVPNRTRLREGTVVSQRPAILTPTAFRERFEGFGDEAVEFSRWISETYRDLLRGLEYKFRNQDLSARVICEDPRLVTQRILADFNARDVTDRAVIRCPDGAWSLALMKFTLDEAASAFPGQVRDLERRGMFSADGGEGERRRRKVEALFNAARRDRSYVPELGRTLREYGFLKEYEDRFLALF